MNNLEQWLRPNIRNLAPYNSARDDFSGHAEVWLDANENALGTPGLDNQHHNRYPDPYQRKLRRAIADYRSVSDKCVFTAHGSDEVIDLVIRAGCRPGHDRILTPVPTYGMYKVSAGINEVAVDTVRLSKDFELDAKAVLAAVRPETKIIFLCSPNNPSGNCHAPEAIHKILTQFEGLVIVDEAYADFAPTRSWVRQLERAPNLLVMQTLSKAWGLAAQRVGIAFAAPSIIKVLNKIKPPYNLSDTAQEKALAALKNADAVEQSIQLLIAQREALKIALNKLSIVDKVFDSDANFLLVRFKNSDAVFDHLKAHGIIVRDRSNQPGCQNCLRITVGTEADNAALIDTLKSL